MTDTYHRSVQYKTITDNCQLLITQTRVVHHQLSPSLHLLTPLVHQLLHMRVWPILLLRLALHLLLLRHLSQSMQILHVVVVVKATCVFSDHKIMNL